MAFVSITLTEAARLRTDSPASRELLKAVQGRDWPDQAFASFANHFANERAGIDRDTPGRDGVRRPHAPEVKGLHGTHWDSLR